LTAREVFGRVVADLLDEEIVLGGVRDEGGVVLQHQVEGGRVWFVFDQLCPIDVEDLIAKPRTGPVLQP
jgi:hypothetical protein